MKSSSGNVGVSAYGNTEIEGLRGERATLPHTQNCADGQVAERNGLPNRNPIKCGLPAGQNHYHKKDGGKTMNSILKQLYDGDISPAEQFRPCLEEYAAKWDKIRKAESVFTEKLTKQQEQEYDKLMDAHSRLMPLEMSQVYADGFKMGARIMCEVFSKEEESVPDLQGCNGGEAGGK